MCVYICRYVHTYVWYIHTCVQMCVHTYIHTCRCIQVGGYVHMYVHTYVHTYCTRVHLCDQELLGSVLEIALAELHVAVPVEHELFHRGLLEIFVL